MCKKMCKILPVFRGFLRIIGWSKTDNTLCCGIIRRVCDAVQVFCSSRRTRGVGHADGAVECSALATPQEGQGSAAGGPSGRHANRRVVTESTDMVWVAAIT